MALGGETAGDFDLPCVYLWLETFPSGTCMCRTVNLTGSGCTGGSGLGLAGSRAWSWAWSWAGRLLNSETLCYGFSKGKCGLFLPPTLLAESHFTGQSAEGRGGAPWEGPQPASAGPHWVPGLLGLGRQPWQAWTGTSATQPHPCPTGEVLLQIHSPGSPREPQALHHQAPPPGAWRGD